MDKRLVLCAVGLAALGVVGCGRFPSPTPTERVSGAGIVVVSASGKVATSTPVGATTRVPPTPTFDPGFGSILTPLAAQPTPTPLAGVTRSPTVEIRPTRTPVATVTPFPTIEIPPTATRVPPGAASPTRAPTSPTPTPRPAATNTPAATATRTPVDPQESAGNRNDDLASASAIAIGDSVQGTIQGPNDVDVYSFPIGEDEDVEDNQIVVTLTGPDMELYRMFLISPGRRSSAFGRPVGTTARHIVYPIQGELGTWFVELSGQPDKRSPRGPYTLLVEVRSRTSPPPEPP